MTEFHQICGSPVAQGVRFFIVLEGDVLVSLEGKKIGKLERGRSFGEEYVLQPNRPFQHRVDSISNSKVSGRF